MHSDTSRDNISKKKMKKIHKKARLTLFFREHKMKRLLKNLVFGKLFMQVKKETTQTENSTRIDLKEVV